MRTTFLRILLSAGLLAPWAAHTHAQTAYQYDLSGNLTNTAPAALASPTITVPPTNQFTPAGSQVAFSVIATGPGPLSYQWLSNGVVMAGATNDTLFLPNVTISGSGYSVVVCNALGCVTNVAPTYPVFVNEKTWVGLSNSDWFNPLNWVPAGVPESNDLVHIGAGAVNLTAPVTISGHLNFTGGTISGSGLSLAPGSFFNWTGGGRSAHR